MILLVERIAHSNSNLYITYNSITLLLCLSLDFVRNIYKSKMANVEVDDGWMDENSVIHTWKMDETLGCSHWSSSPPSGAPRVFDVSLSRCALV